MSLCCASGSLPLRDTPHDHSFCRGPTGSGKDVYQLWWYFKIAKRREDVASENFSQSPRCAIFRERCDIFHAGKWKVLVVMSADVEMTLQGWV
jgi:hypothetical protein